jgi:hypothetical protein
VGCEGNEIEFSGEHSDSAGTRGQAPGHLKTRDGPGRAPQGTLLSRLPGPAAALTVAIRALSVPLLPWLSDSDVRPYSKWQFRIAIRRAETPIAPPDL